MARFSSKVVIVTGGSSGIGRTTALAFAREGAKIVIASRSREEGEEAAAQIKEAGGEALFVLTDVSREADVENMVSRTLAAFGKLDIAFNNAGVEQPPQPLTDLSEADYYRVFDVNVKGVFLCLKHELAHMSEGGAIVNTSSLSAVQGFAQISLYSASKHAVVGLTKCVALEVGRRGIRVNAVLPGATNTEMLRRSLGQTDEAMQAVRSAHPLGRMAEPEDIANAVLFLASDECFLDGQAITVDGGYTVG